MPNKDKLQHIAHHVSYEVEMFELTAEKLKKGGIEQFENNVLIESFVSHTRNLLDFLYFDLPAKPDDVLAVDFFVHAKDFQNKRPVISDIKK